MVMRTNPIRVMEIRDDADRSCIHSLASPIVRIVLETPATCHIQAGSGCPNAVASGFQIDVWRDVSFDNSLWALSEFGAYRSKVVSSRQDESDCPRNSNVDVEGFGLSQAVRSCVTSFSKSSQDESFSSFIWVILWCFRELFRSFSSTILMQPRE